MFGLDEAARCVNSAIIICLDTTSNGICCEKCLKMFPAAGAGKNSVAGPLTSIDALELDDDGLADERIDKGQIVRLI